LKLKCENLELVSLHIPKTAGTSFRTVLQERYGKRQVLHFDIYPSGAIHAKGKALKGCDLGKKTKVLHGHFGYRDLYEKVEINPKTPVITWLRHPVERVVSNYFFLNKIMAGRLKERPDENLLARMGRSLSEFAQQEENQNRMSHFLAGADLKSFHFVGIQDYFEEDLQRLALSMQWPMIANRVHNATEVKKPEISEAEYQLIESLNQRDIDLYEEALNLRNQSLKLNT
jgi:hypothetical protein